MNVLKRELRKLIFNGGFIASLFVLVVISLINAVQVIAKYYNYIDVVCINNILDHNTLAPTLSVYTLWIGGKENIFGNIFFSIIFGLLSVPCSISYYLDIKRKSLVVNNTQSKIKNNFIKYISVFISSGLLVTIPLLINLMIFLLFVPATVPDSVYDIYYNIFSFEFLSDIFYSYPLLYVLIYIFAFFVFCGLIGTLGYVFLLLFKRPLISILMPLVLIMLIHFTCEFMIQPNIIISPISYMNVASNVLRNYQILIAEIFLLFLLTFPVSVFGNKDVK